MPHINDPLLQAYIDGYCNENRVAEIEQHVAACEDCRRRLEEAQTAASRASQLLGALDPGPVHAPSFEELQERAAARAADEDAGTADEVVVPPVIVAGAPTRRPSLWGGQSLAWAATVVVAFSVGWFLRSGVDLPPELQVPASSSLEGFDQRAGEAAPGAAPPPPSAADEPASREEMPAEETVPRQDAVDELDDAQALKRTVAPGTIAEPETEPVATPAPAVAGRRQAGAADAKVAGELRAAAEQPRAARARENAPADQEAVGVELNEQVAGVATFADAATVGGFYRVDRDTAEQWLGVALREIPDLDLTGIEIAPGTSLDTGLAGHAAVRLVYRDSAGQRITLTQQYTRPIARREGAQLGQAYAYRATPLPARAERDRAASEARTDDLLSVDADLASTLDLPVTTQLPQGGSSYTWLDDDGYLLSLSGNLEATFLRGLVTRIR